MSAPSDDAYRLRATAEYWQHFATHQQELASELREQARRQHELGAAYGGTDAGELMIELQRVEDELRSVSEQAVSLERQALDRLARAIADEARALGPEK